MEQIPAPTHVLVKFEKNWADEFDTHGLAVYTIEQWNARKLELDIFFGKIGTSSPEIESSFGTNESHTFNSASDILDNVEEILIASEQANTIISTIGQFYGVLPYLSWDDEEWSF